MSLDVFLATLGASLCSGLMQLSAQISESAGCSMDRGPWTVGLGVLGLCLGLIVAIAMWREKTSPNRD